jgi:hypothetical protein
MVFFPIFLLLLNALQDYQKKKTRIIFIILAFFSLSVTERGAVYVSVACLVFAFSARKNRLLIIFTGLTSLTWSLFYYKFISTDTYPNSFFDQAKSIEGLTSLLFTVPTFKLILFHLPGFLLMRKMRDLQIFLIICMGPNLIGNIGGAEKIGWVTHYMSYLAASYIGMILVYVSRVLNENFDTEKIVRDKENNRFGSQISQHLVTIAPVLACMLFLFVNPNSSTKILGTSAAAHSGIFGKSLQWLYQGANTIEYKSFQQRKEYLAKTLPENARIGISEGTAKYVSDKFKNIYMFPAGIEKLDFAVLKSSVGELGAYRQDAIINYSNPESGVQLSEEIQAMLLGRCFKDITPKEYYPLHIFQRVPSFKLDESCTKSD